jgi:hypothetical protein
MRGRLLLAVALALAVTGCSGSGPAGHHAEVLDITLATRAADLRVAPQRFQDVPATTERTIVLLDVTIANGSSRAVWADDCHGRALDANDKLVFEFTFGTVDPAGVYIAAHRSFVGRVEAVALTSPKAVRNATHVEAECAAWDWGDNPPE